MKQLRESEEFFDDNFFVIDSSMTDIKVRMYGYVLIEDKLLINSNECNYPFPYDSYGSWVNVVDKDNHITIYQDFYGSYGLYLYQKDGYFAISNSLLYIINYLKTRHEMTFDHEFAKAFIIQNTSSLVYKDTIIKEIECLPRDTYVSIDKTDRTVKVERYNLNERCVSMDSKEAFEIIDRWVDRWNKLYAAVIRHGSYLQFGISGGKDSRMALSTLLSPSVDMSKVYVLSVLDDKYTHGEDHEIAVQLAKTYGFKLNEGGVALKRYNIDPYTNMNSTLMTRFGCHKEMLYTGQYSEKVEFRITGNVDASLRQYWSVPFDDFIHKESTYPIYNGFDGNTAHKNMLIRSKEQMECDHADETYRSDWFYRYIRSRYHLGRAHVELFLANRIFLDPIMDPALTKLNQFIGRENDSDLLYTSVFCRYMPEVINLKFDSGRTIKPETIDVARELNEKYPRSAVAYDNVYETFEVLEYPRVKPPRSLSNNSPKQLMTNAFLDDELKECIISLFGENVYDKAYTTYKSNGYHADMDMAALIQIYIAYKACEDSVDRNNYSKLDLNIEGSDLKDIRNINYFNNGFVTEMMDFLKSGRIDVKCVSKNTGVTLIDSSDANMYIEKTGNAGTQGVILQSIQGDLSTRIRCAGEGKLRIAFKGPFLRYSDGKVLPIKIDYTSIKIVNDKGETVINSNNQISVSHDRPYEIQVDFKDGAEYTISVKWMPFCYDKSEFISLMDKLFEQSINTLMFWKRKRYL